MSVGEGINKEIHPGVSITGIMKCWLDTVAGYGMILFDYLFQANQEIIVSNRISHGKSDEVLHVHESTRDYG